MRWRAEPKLVTSDNAVRERQVFAWRPTRVGEHTVWLEFYLLREIFFKPVNGQPGWWSEKSRHILDWY